MNQEIIPSRLKSARQLRGMSMEDLSLAIDGRVSKQAISKYERGQMRPSVEVLQAVAQALRLPFSYFFQRGVEIGEVCFRANGKLPSDRTREQMILVAQDKIERYLQVEDLLSTPQLFQNPLEHTSVRNAADVESLADEVRQNWNLGHYPIFSVYDMLEGLGVKIIEFPAGSDCALGFSTFVNHDIPLIVVNTSNNHTTERKRFTVLHELAHLLLDFHDSVSLKECERLCHRFAGALLCPSAVFYNELGRHRSAFSLHELISMRSRYGISIAAIVHRTKDLRIISKVYYNHIYDTHIHANPMEEGWGEYPISESTDRFERLLHRAVAEKLISEEEAMEMGEWTTEHRNDSLVLL